VAAAARVATSVMFAIVAPSSGCAAKPRPRPGFGSPRPLGVKQRSRRNHTTTSYTTSRALTRACPHPTSRRLPRWCLSSPCERMQAVSLVERLERELYAAATASPRDSARYAVLLERAVRMCDADPEAVEVFDLAELYLELATEYSGLGRHRDALAAG